MERDPMRARVYLERACTRGSMSGCAVLAAMYQQGEGGPPDTRRAIELFEEACRGSAFDACTRLGRLYIEGIGVPPDHELAAEYFDRSCAGGDLVGCANLGLMYQGGYGVEEDAERAGELFAAACHGGLAQACRLATDGVWDLSTYEPDATPPQASARARFAAGASASLRISCTRETVEVAIQWPGRAEVDDLELTSTLGRQETTASDWAFDAELNRHTYRGNARALVETLTTLEHETLYVATSAGSTSFVLNGLSDVAVPLGRACNW